MDIIANDASGLTQLQELHRKHGGQHLAVTLQLPDTPEAILDLLQTRLWPDAVPSSMIVKDDQGKKIRAMSVISSFVREPLAGKKFLDFGCEAGQCVTEAIKQGAVALGYDAVPSPSWNSNECTDSLAVVDAAGPFDVILAYDVFDHITDNKTRFSMLKKLRGWLAPGGTVYARCHPYTSRHGTHLYYKLNKAYAHLLLPKEYEGGIPTAEILAPVATYTKWFQDSGFQVAKQVFTRQDPEPFFNGLQNLLIKRVAPGNRYVQDAQTLNSVLGIQFVDYELKHHPQ